MSDFFLPTVQIFHYLEFISNNFLPVSTREAMRVQGVSVKLLK